jgi:hypothetical protein
MKPTIHLATKPVPKKPRHSNSMTSAAKQLAEPNAKMHFINANDFLYAAAVKFCNVSLDEYLESYQQENTKLKK